MIVDMGIFVIMALRYKYRDDSVTVTSSEDATQETTANSNGDGQKQ